MQAELLGGTIAEHMHAQNNDETANHVGQGCTTHGPDPAPEHVLSGPRSRLPIAKNFS